MGSYLLKRGQVNIVNVLIGIIFLLFLMVGGYFVYKLFYGPSEGDVVVPNVIGYDIYDAKNNLKLIGLDIEVVSTSFSDKPKNMILNQEPPAGIKVKKGRIIKVVISKGVSYDKQLLLPDLVGYNINEINLNPNLKFNKLNLIYNYLYYPSMSFKDGTILMQSPQPDTTLDKDKKISFLVSKELNPQELINNSNDYLPELWKNLDKADSLFIQFKNNDVIEDRKITTSYIYNDTVIVEANLNYSQIPDIKIINLVLKFKYSKDISNVKVYLDDFLGKRLVFDSYYVGQTFSNLKLFYIGDAKVSVYLNNNKVADYSLP
ncbi:MAG: PASTA domain-containing protein [bacterium]|nr:PASTA domain-containing protein [bacterium]